MRRLKTWAQYQTVLASPVVARTTHFALHRRRLEPANASRFAEAGGGADAPLFLIEDVWIGALVPKRWARRAVTRNLLKRQIYQVSKLLEQLFPVAAHVVRLRAEFDRARFASAASRSLRQTAANELRQLIRQAATALPSGEPA